MSASGPLQVQVSGSPIGMSDVNNSVGMLQRAISDYGARSDKRRNNALTALEGQSKLIDEKNISQILQDTDRNVFDQKVLNQQEQYAGKDALGKYNTMFDANGNPLINKDAAKQKQLLADQNAYMGDYTPGMTNEQIDVMRNNPDANQGTQILQSFGEANPETAGMVTDTPTEYGNRIYNQMLAQGIHPDEAQKYRDSAIKKETKTGPSEQELDLIKTKLKNNEELTKIELEEFYKSRKISEQSGTGTNPASGSSGSSTGKGSLKEFLGTEGIDTGSSWIGKYISGGVGADLGNDAYNKLVNDGYSKNQIKEMLMSNTVNEWFGGQKEFDARSADDLYIKALGVAKARGFNPGNSLNGVGNGKTFKNTNTTRYLPGTDKMAQQLIARSNERADAISKVRDPNARKILSTASEIETYVGDWGSDILKIPNTAGNNEGNGKSIWKKDSIIGKAMGPGSKAGDVVRAANEKPEEFAKAYKDLGSKKKILVDNVVKNTADKYGDLSPNKPVDPRANIPTGNNPLGLSQGDLDTLAYEANRDKPDAGDANMDDFINNVLPQQILQDQLGMNEDPFSLSNFKPTREQILIDNNEKDVRRARRYDKYSKKAGEMFGDIDKGNLAPDSKYESFNQSDPNTADTVRPNKKGPILTDLDIQTNDKVLNDMILSYSPENEIVAQVKKMFPHLDDAAIRKLIQRRQQQLPN